MYVLSAAEKNQELQRVYQATECGRSRSMGFDE